MAKMTNSNDVIDDISKKLAQLGEDVSGELGKKMLDTGAEIIKKNWKKSIEKHGHIKTGAMRDSVDTAKGSKNKAFRDIYPQGNDKKGVRNAEKAFIAHWGKPGKQLGTRFVEEAEANAEAECAEAMQEKLYEYLDKKGM